jgi:hypothetical protein
VKKLIDYGLIGTTVTTVLIGVETSQRKFVDYEIAKSIDRGNGLLEIYINLIKDSKGNTDWQGSAPWRLTTAGAPCFYWDKDKFGGWIEEAYKKAHRNG